MFDYTYHDDETLNKVYKGLKRANVPRDLIANAVNCIMNEGIVFREPAPPAPIIVNSDPAPPYRPIEAAEAIVEGLQRARREPTNG